MTASEFKKLKPEYENIEGDELWDAMTMYVLQQQEASEIIKKIKPIWKTHTLRWLFYRKVPNWVMPTSKTDWYKANDRCGKCKVGVNARIMWSSIDKDGNGKMISICPNCSQEYVAEPNTNYSHIMWKEWMWLCGLFWKFLDKIHLVRSSIHGRYDMFGDEIRYVKRISMNLQTRKLKYTFKKRKWGEYILIEKPFHNF